MVDASPGPIRSFAEFWPFYVGAHRRPTCRALHYAGGLGALAAVGAAFATWSWWWLLAAPVLGYGCSWLAHFRVERNHPATFGDPLWSLIAEFKMLWLGITGRMRGEVARLYGGDAKS